MPSPKLCIGDGALGFWKALGQVYPTAEWQQCWVHKTANVLDKMPKSIQSSAKSLIYDLPGRDREGCASCLHLLSGAIPSQVSESC
jgi:transposase-like protein